MTTVQKVWVKKGRPFLCIALEGPSQGEKLLVLEPLSFPMNSFYVWNGTVRFITEQDLKIEHLLQIDTIGKLKKEISITPTLLSELLTIGLKRENGRNITQGKIDLSDTKNEV